MPARESREIEKTRAGVALITRNYLVKDVQDIIYQQKMFKIRSKNL